MIEIVLCFPTLTMGSEPFYMLRANLFLHNLTVIKCIFMLLDSSATYSFNQSELVVLTVRKGQRNIKLGIFPWRTYSQLERLELEHV